MAFTTSLYSSLVIRYSWMSSTEMMEWTVMPNSSFTCCTAVLVVSLPISQRLTEINISLTEDIGAGF